MDPVRYGYLRRELEVDNLPGDEAVSRLFGVACRRRPDLTLSGRALVSVQFTANAVSELAVLNRQQAGDHVGTAGCEGMRP